jgi:signal transduction histidine kinase
MSLFHPFIEGLPEPCILISPSGIIQDVSPSFARRLGKDSAYFEGKDLSTLVSDPERTSRYLKLCSRNHQFVLGSIGFALQNQILSLRCEGTLMKGTQAPLLFIRFRPKIAAAEKFTLLNQKLGELQVEVEKRRRAENALSMAQQDLKAHLATLERTVEERTHHLREINEQMLSFLYTVSHDLRAPVRSITSYAAILEEEAPSLSPDCKEYIARIQRSAANMNRLLVDLLEYSRVKKRDLPLEPMPFEDTVRSILAQNEEQLQTHRAVVEFLPGENCRILGNFTVIEQVISNVLSNAVKFVPRERSPHVKVIGSKQPPFARLSIQDNGNGIEPQYHQKIFELFERLPQGMASQGSGVGLAIVAAGMQRLGGKVSLDSQPGEGSTFHLDFPLAPDQ